MLEALLLLSLAPAALTQTDRTPAEALHTPRPRYPREALRSGIEGTVVIEFVIDPTGQAESSGNDRIRARAGHGGDRGGEAVALRAGPIGRHSRLHEGARARRVPARSRQGRRAAAPDRPRCPLAISDPRTVVVFAEGSGELPWSVTIADLLHRRSNLTSPALRLARFVACAAAEPEHPSGGRGARRRAPTWWSTSSEDRHRPGRHSTTGVHSTVRGSTMQTCPQHLATSIALQGRAVKELTPSTTSSSSRGRRPRAGIGNGDLTVFDGGPYSTATRNRARGPWR